MKKGLLFLIRICCVFLIRPLDSFSEEFLFQRGEVLPLPRYVQLVSQEKVIPIGKQVVLEKEEIARLKIVFLRDSLKPADGPQFLKITIVVKDRNGQVIDENEQYAITFYRLEDPKAEMDLLREYVHRVNPMGWFNPESIEAIPIQIDSLTAWGEVRIRVEMEKDIMKYYGRIKNKLEYSILVRGASVQLGVALSVPKVLYDTCKKDSVHYGNTSAMVRFFFLNKENGVRCPLSLGIGTFGVESPIDVSRSGGGFAISFYLDVIQLFGNRMGRFSHKINAGIDISPFLPIGHKPRILLSARVGILP